MTDEFQNYSERLAWAQRQLELEKQERARQLKQSCLQGLVYMGLTVGAWIINFVWGGYVLTIIWNANFVSRFHAPVLILPLAMIIMLLIRMLFPVTEVDFSNKSVKQIMEIVTKVFVRELFIPLFTLIIANILHTFL